MVDILITSDAAGGTSVLTTNSPLSRYNSPVLQVIAQDINGEYGPADVIEIEPGRLIHIADIVYGWGRSAYRTSHEREVARLFLSQWPEGPQLTK